MQPFFVLGRFYSWPGGIEISAKVLRISCLATAQTTINSIEVYQIGKNRMKKTTLTKQICHKNRERMFVLDIEYWRIKFELHPFGPAVQKWVKSMA